MKLSEDFNIRTNCSFHSQCISKMSTSTNVEKKKVQKQQQVPDSRKNHNQQLGGMAYKKYNFMSCVCFWRYASSREKFTFFCCFAIFPTSHSVASLQCTSVWQKKLFVEMRGRARSHDVGAREKNFQRKAENRWNSASAHSQSSCSSHTRPTITLKLRMSWKRKKKLVQKWEDSVCQCCLPRLNEWAKWFIKLMFAGACPHLHPGVSVCVLPTSTHAEWKQHQLDGGEMKVK